MALKCQEMVMLPELGSFELGFEESTELCQTEKQEESHSRSIATKESSISTLHTANGCMGNN